MSKSGFLNAGKGCPNPRSAWQKMRDFAVENGITGSWVETSKSGINATFYFVMQGDVKAKDGATILTTQSRKAAYKLRDEINREMAQLRGIYGERLGQ